LRVGQGSEQSFVISRVDRRVVRRHEHGSEVGKQGTLVARPGMGPQGRACPGLDPAGEGPV
jgi:hypothetical protein